MKRFLLSVVLATTLVLTSCKFDDSDIWETLNEYGESIRDHEQRISALEELCKQMNTNIEALQTIVAALEKRDYVTNVSEVRSNGEVIGYTISFAYSDTVTIYHGKDGVNGKDGYTPQIGVMKDTDGIYYWTLDGEWLLDGKGNKIQANGVNGTDGTNGTNGTNGVDGITPCLKIENDYWFVSYDNGVTWKQLGKATGEDGTDGNDGIDGEDGDSIFKSVTQDDEYVYFSLSDGTMITLPKHDKENIQFEDLQVKAICCKHWDTNNDGELSYAEAAAVTSLPMDNNYYTPFSNKTNIIAFTEFKYFTGITKIPMNAFRGCWALWKIEIPENVQTIENDAFLQCEGINSITIPDSVTLVGSNVFGGCCSLKNVTIGKGLAKIGGAMFSGCDNLTNVTIPNNVSEIEEYAFSSCSSLTSITIPDSIIAINKGAFANCTSLRCIYCRPTAPPAIYYNISSKWSSSFPFNSEMVIYVPRNSYNEYNSANSYADNRVAKSNWYAYKEYIQPYDFE